MVVSAFSSRVVPMLAAALVVSVASGINSCLDPTDTAYKCAAGTTKISVSFTCSLVDNDIPDLQACFDAAGRSTVEEIMIFGTELSSLPVDLFADMSKMTTLRIMRNRLKVLPLGLFEDTTALTILNLSSNDFSTFPDGIFAPLTSLKSMWIDGMPNIQCLPTSTAVKIIHSSESVRDGTCECTPANAVSCPEGTTCSPGTEGYTCGEAAAPTTCSTTPAPFATPRQTINSCLDPTHADYKCAAGTTKISVSLGMDDDIPDLQACFDVAGRSTVEEITILGTEFTSLPVDLFAGMSKMTTLRIMRNPPKTLPLGLFEDTTGLSLLRFPMTSFRR